jgi:peroxiredoxin
VIRLPLPESRAGLPAGKALALALRYTSAWMPVKLTPKASILLFFLVAITIPLTWKAKSLERKLFGHTDENALLDKPAPVFALKSLAGEQVSSSDFRGKKKVVVSFWASWCGPCRIELPELQAFYEKYHANNNNFEILAISTDENPKAAEQYVREAKLTFPVLWDGDSKASDSFGVAGIPVLFVIDENGKITMVQSGYGYGLEFRLIQALGLKKIPVPVKDSDDDAGN